MSLWQRGVLLDRFELDHYPYVHSTRAETPATNQLYRRGPCGYERALALIHTDHERLFVERRLTEQRTWPALP